MRQRQGPAENTDGDAQEEWEAEDETKKCTSKVVTRAKSVRG